MLKRLFSTIRLDATIQWRNRFYYVGIGLSLLMALGLAQGLDHALLPGFLPVLFLFAIGGTTLLYVAGLLIFEKDEHTLDAVIVSPLRLDEYLIAKLVSLTFLALLESLVVVFLSWGFTGFNALLLVGGIVLLGLMLTLLGIVMIVRYDSITDFLVPVLVVALVLQLPFVYFTGLSDSLLWLLIPTSAPTMLMWAAWQPVAGWQLLYGLIYSLIVVGGMYVWAKRAFTRHIILGRAA